MDPCYRDSVTSGCSAAWLARHVRDVEAAGSNPATPTEGVAYVLDSDTATPTKARSESRPPRLLVWVRQSKARLISLVPCRLFASA